MNHTLPALELSVSRQFIFDQWSHHIHHRPLMLVAYIQSNISLTSSLHLPCKKDVETSVFDTGRPVPTLAMLYCICLCRSLQALVGSFPHSGQYFWLLRLGVNHTPQISHSFCFVSTSKFLLSFLVWEKYERYYCNTKSRQDKNTFFFYEKNTDRIFKRPPVFFLTLTEY